MEQKRSLCMHAVMNGWLSLPSKPQPGQWAAIWARTSPTIRKLAESGNSAAKKLLDEAAQAKCPKPQPPTKSKAEPTQIQHLVVASCFYNPCRYQRPLENWNRWKAGMDHAGAQLATIELVFDDDRPQTPGGQMSFYVHGTRVDNLMWQKERLLNILLEELPQFVDAVAWVDTDVMFLNENWLEETKAALGGWHVVQPFVDSYDVQTTGTLSHDKTSVAWYWQNEPKTHNNLSLSHPGFAWAARRSALPHGLYDRNITGGGDSTMIPGFTGCYLRVNEACNEAWRNHCCQWCQATYQTVHGALGYVRGCLLHRAHGTRENRKYMDRWRYLAQNDYDPATDVEIDPETRLLRWTEHARSSKPRMIEQVSGYFAERKEDD